MSAQLVGGVIGAALGLVNFFLLNNAAEKVVQNSEDGTKSTAAKLLKWAAWADLVIFPLIGYYIGGLFAS